MCAGNGVYETMFRSRSLDFGSSSSRDLRRQQRRRMRGGEEDEGHQRQHQRVSKKESGLAVIVGELKRNLSFRNVTAAANSR